MITSNKGVKVRDLVCGMLIDLGDDPKRAEYEGESFFFCSESCKKRFLKEAEKYIGKQRGV